MTKKAIIPSLEKTRTSLRRHMPEPEALKLITEALARKYTAIPLAIDGDALRVAMANPSDIFALEALASRSQMRIEPELVSDEEILDARDFNYKAYDEIEKQIANISRPTGTTEGQVRLDTAIDAPVAQALTLIIDEAVKARTSDIHLQPDEDRLRVRYRIDGTLQDLFSLPLTTANPLISRIKILANMNIADHYRPQDGQFSVKTKGRLIDIRVASVATVYGEMATLRLLDKSRATLALPELGFLPESLENYEKMLRVSHGMILICGPTGAGKTTTLYASLNTLDKIERNIITIEDPVEYRFKNINQILKPGGIICLIDLDYNCMTHFGIPERLERAIQSIARQLEKKADFDPFVGRKLYCHLFDLGYHNIAVDMMPHHLIFGDLKDGDALNWRAKMDVAARNSGYDFSEYTGGYSEFREEFQRAFGNPRRFTYTPVILCRGQKPT